jgi:hypothetical protein
MYYGQTVVWKRAPSSADGNRGIRPRDATAKKASRLACLTSLVKFDVSRDRLQSGYVLACFYVLAYLFGEHHKITGLIKITPIVPNKLLLQTRETFSAIHLHNTLT